MSLYIPPRPIIAKAGPVGPGAGVLTTEFPLSLILNKGTPQQRMQSWLRIAREASWPEAAERVIGSAIAGQAWQLEDQQGEAVDDAYPDPLAVAAFQLIEKPQAKTDLGAKYSRSVFWKMTLRHVGICGNGFWYFDQMNPYGWPLAFLYIQPWRMTPNEDANGNLLSWQLDKTPTSPGLKIELRELLHFMLFPPDTGHYGRGVMEMALLKAQNDAAFDKHVTQVLSAGGRLSGLLSPKQGDAINDQQYGQLVADARTVVEQPDAAKRLQIMRGPVEFTQTTMTIADLQVAELLKLYRDDTLGLWGVPSGLLVPQATGINSGEARKYDKQVMWENAAHDRVIMFEETIQVVIDRWADQGITLDFEIDEPEFSNDDARYDLLGKSQNTPMRNAERRDLIGLEPFGPEVINPATGAPVDDEIWLPSTQVLAFTAMEIDDLLDADEQGFGDELDDPDMAQTEGDAAAVGETPQSGAIPAASKAGPAVIFGRANPAYTKGPSSAAYGKTATAADVKQELANIEARARAKGLKPNRQQVLDTYRRNQARRQGAGRNAKRKEAKQARAAHVQARVQATVAAQAQPATQRTTTTFTGPPRKADLHGSLTQVRKQLDVQYTPRVRHSVSRVLADQKTELVSRVRARLDHLLANRGRDLAGLWDDAKWNARLKDALAPDLTMVAQTVDGHIRDILRPGKASSSAAVANALTHGGTRITALNARTRDAVLTVVRETVASAIDKGLSPAEAGDELEAAIGATALDNGMPAWDEYRAELVARTEMTAAYNDATLGSYGDLGVTQVQAIDGDGDEECAARDGRTFSIEEADGIEDHPNGTLDWIPIIPEAEAE